MGPDSLNRRDMSTLQKGPFVFVHFYNNVRTTQFTVPMCIDHNLLNRLAACMASDKTNAPQTR